MKTRILILSALIGLIVGQIQGQTLLYDDFNGSPVNTNLWDLSLPFGYSQAYQSNGYAVMIGRGAFNTKPSLPVGIEAIGRFKFTGSEDFFQLSLRSDLVIDPAYGERYGVHVKFSDNGQSVRIVEYSHTNVVDVVPAKTFNFVGNTSYDFRITDDGLTVRVYLTNSTTPFLTGSTAYRAGNKVSIYNREYSYSISQLDFIQINPFKPLTIYPAIELEFLTKSNGVFYIEASPDFITWTNFDGPFVGNGNPWSKTYPSRGTPKLFFRANELP